MSSITIMEIQLITMMISFKFSPLIDESCLTFSFMEHVQKIALYALSVASEELKLLLDE